MHGLHTSLEQSIHRILRLGDLLSHSWHLCIGMVLRLRISLRNDPGLTIAIVIYSSLVVGVGGNGCQWDGPSSSTKLSWQLSFAQYQ